MDLSRRLQRPEPIEDGRPRLRFAYEVRTHPMRAVGYFAPGPITAPNSLVDVELPRPSATGRELLVEVRAVSVNPLSRSR
jgi:hypothetical protein